MLKRFLAYIASLCILCSCLSLTATAEPGSTQKDFISAVCQLISETWDDDFYSEMLINLDDNGVKPTVDSTNAIVPITQIMEAEGKRVKVDYDRLVMTVEKGNTKEEFKISPQTSLFSSDNRPSGDEIYLSIEQAEDQFGYVVFSDQDKLIVSNPYQTMRLYLKTTRELTSDYGASFKLFDGNDVYVLQYSDEKSTRNAYHSLKKDPSVLMVCRDGIVSSDDINGETLWGTQRIYSNQYSYSNDLSDKPPITVAVLDSGIDADHEFLSGRIGDGGKNFTSTEETNLSDQRGHGTHVAGTIKDNTPDNVKILPVKVLDANGRGSFIQIALGVDYAVQQGVSVINMSLSGSVSDTDSLILEESLDEAYQRGVSVVVTAGNNAADCANVTPARSDKCITVAASDQDDYRASFSNYGVPVDVTAPGVGILSSIPGGNYQSMDGTSMAAPHVAAAAALLKLSDPESTPENIKNALISSAVDAYSPGRDDYFGHGILDFRIKLNAVSPLQDILITPEQASICHSIVGDVLKPQIKTQPLYVANKSYTFTNTDGNIATASYVDGGMVITPHKTGDTVFTFNMGDKQLDYNLQVKASDRWVDNPSTDDFVGTGTYLDPYLIDSVPKLAKMSHEAYSRDLGDTYFKQTAHIDFAESQYVWTPIPPTALNYDGGGFQIKNLKINNPTSPGVTPDLNISVGLFSHSEGFLRNINLTDATISGRENVGGIVGGMPYNPTGVIDGCSVSGNVSGSKMVGGIAGYHANIINACYSEGGVSGSINVGGIAGNLMIAYNSQPYISNCYSKTKVTVDPQGGYAGGLVGVAGCSFVNSYFNGTMNAAGAKHVGDIAGDLGPCYITDRYYQLGTQFSAPKIINCFSVGGGENLVGRIQMGEVISCYDEYEVTNDWDDGFPWNFTKVWDDTGVLPVLRKSSQEYTDHLYTAIGDGIQIVKYLGDGGQVRIPDTLEARPVKYIGSRAFMNQDGIESVILPDTIVSIGDMAFSGLRQMSRIHIPTSVNRIGTEAFKDCVKLESVILPRNLKEISNAAFLSSGLKGVAIPATVEKIGITAFPEGLKRACFLGEVPSFGENAFGSLRDSLTISFQLEHRDNWTENYKLDYQTKLEDFVIAPTEISSDGDMLFEVINNTQDENGYAVAALYDENNELVQLTICNEKPLELNANSLSAPIDGATNIWTIGLFVWEDLGDMRPLAYHAIVPVIFTHQGGER